ncbi:MAG: hypothetical protein E7310_01185 [Clostridiales bacterium]|nr:hypothetical protein [Clostridiales bacterium]
MDLGFFRNVEKGLGGVKEFLKELSNYLEDDISIIEKIKKENKVNLASSIEMKKTRNELLVEYSKNQEELYYVLSKSDKTNRYSILKISPKGEIEKMQVNGENLSENIRVDSIIKLNNEKFIVNQKLTQNFKEKFTKEANKILNKQNKMLDNIRREGAFYYVIDGNPNRIFLTMFNSNKVFEEVNFPDELRNKISEGVILKYERGTYHIDEKKTEENFEGKLSID